MKKSNKAKIVLSLTGFLVILAWKSVHTESCLVLAFPITIIIIISMSVIEFSAKKKECLAQFYFIESSLLYRLYNSKKILFIKSLLLSVLLGTSLMIAVVFWDIKIIQILFFDIFILYWIYAKTLNILAGSIKKMMKYVIAKDISVSINTFLLIVSILIVEIYSPIPIYVDISLKTTLISAYNIFSSECTVINFLLKLNAEKDAFSWWAMLNVDNHINDKNLKILAWTTFLLSNSLAAYAYSRYMIQLIDLFRLFGDENEQ